MGAFACYAVFLHSNDMSCLTKRGLEEHCFNACHLDCVQDLKISDLVLPVDIEDGTEDTYRKLLQLFNVSTVQCPGLGPLEKRCENNGTVDLQLREGSNVVLIEHPSANAFKCLACFVDP